VGYSPWAYARKTVRSLACTSLGYAHTPTGAGSAPRAFPQPRCRLEAPIRSLADRARAIGPTTRHALPLDTLTLYPESVNLLTL
jgi:hypothetical protein